MANRTRTVICKAAAALAAAIVLGACSGAPHHRSITLTFIRHAQSENNADGVIDTDVPGPGLTAQGRGQAEQIAHQLERNHYDGVYASSMLRSRQTAAPLAEEIGRQVQILPGLREIDAGWYNGGPSSRADLTYLLAPKGWVQGNRVEAVPGSINGNQFNDQFGAAVQKIYDSGDANPVAFSHGAAIMSWTLMNVKNPQDSLMTDHPLPNIGRVVISGNPMTGWKLVDWDGVRRFS
jgi:broad specificity phosphatase PhoE